MKTEKRNKFQKRVAYLKNGDVTEEVKALTKISENEYLGNGGPYHYIGSFLKWAKGSQVLLISQDLSDKHLITKNGIDAYVLNTKKYSSKFEKIFLQVKSFLKILFILGKFKPQFILCAISGGVPFAVSYLIAKYYKIPFIHTRHMRIESFKPSIVVKFRSKIDGWLIRNADAVLCNGPYLKDQLKIIGVDDQKIIKFDLPYNNLKYLRDERFGEKLSGGYKCKLLFLGRIEENKGALDLFTAFTETSKTNDVSLTYIGDGRLSEQLRNMAVKFGINDKVNFLGALPHSAAMKEMNNFDILIVPTRQELGEGRCKTIIEGLILGIPVVAPDYGAFRYLITNGFNGLLYKPDDIFALRSKIERLSKDDILRKQLSKNARKFSEELLKPEITFSQALEKVSPWNKGDLEL